MKTELQKMIDGCTSELNEIKRIIHELKPLDKTKAYLTMYALMKASGTIEFVYRSIVADYFEAFNIHQIDYHLEKFVRKGHSSAKYNEMLKLLENFDENWHRCFKQNVNNRRDSNRLIQSSESLVSNRHLFAHGRQPTATFEEIYNYYLDCLELVKEFDSAVHN